MQQSGHDVAIKFSPFRMRPDVPADGLDEPPRMYLDRRYVANVQARGKEIGLDYSHKCQRVPNTLKAHVLQDYAFELSTAKQMEVAEIIFRKYHTDGLDPTDLEVLVSAATEAGLDASEVRAILTDPTRQAATAQKIQHNARRTGGVPTFIVNGQNIGSGAQPPAVLMRAFEVA